MISVKVGGSPDLARQGRARQKLFVEGSDSDVIDAEALKVLLCDMIDIEVMGPSFHLKSVATALHPHHADYYFLIDRDHHDDQTVNDSWINFPDRSRSNLLIWRKKEIENYFLDPDYLQRSQWIMKQYNGNAGRAQLENQIIRFANQRLFMDVANRVILTIREKQKQNWIETFTNPDKFPDAQTAKQLLLDKPEFQKREKNVACSVKADEVRRLFEDFLSMMSGDQSSLAFGRGTWCEHMSGKEILRQTINNCFQVRDRDFQIVQGKQKYIEVIKT